MSEEMNNGRAGRILVVDDTTANLQFLTNLLTDQGYTVHPASDGELALEFVRTTLPDLILLDIRMPGMDGYEVCRRLKEDEKTRDVPVIFISVLDDERDKVRGFREGAVDYISKPFQPEEVLARIRTHLRLRELTERLEQKVAERTAELQREMVERMLAEEELRFTNALLKTQQETSQDGILVVDERGKIVSFNQRFIDMWCIPPEIVHSRSDERALQSVLERLVRPEEFLAKVRHLYEHWDERSQDELVLVGGATFDRYSAPLCGPGGEYYGRVWYFRDISERKRMENTLRESEELFRTLTEKSLVGVYIIQDDLYRYVNPAFAKIHGYSSEELIDKLGPVDILTSEDRERVMDSVRRRKVGEIEFSHHEFSIRRKDGSIRVIEAFGSRALLQGRPAIIGTIIDVTERRRSEEKLFQVTERWERTFDAVPDLIAIIDTDFRIVQANKAMADRLGLAPAECAGEICYKVVHNTEAPPPFCPHAQTARDFREHTAEVSVERLGGDFVVTTSPLYDSAGELIGSVHIARDVTERRKAEEERKHLEAQLHHAQKMEAIGQLAGGVAHDFNNILTAIIGYGEILLMRMEKETTLRHFVEQLLASADRAAELTKSLLTFSRRQVLHARPMDLCGVVRRIKKMLKRLLPEDIVFRTTITEETLIVMADRGQIEQVLMNLATNARDAMPKGGTLKIDVSPALMDEGFAHAHGFGEPGPYACISVADSGHGMDEETRERIFEPFFTTKEVGKGTGLGMAIVYSIIQQHNGCITVDSKPERGTTFRIYLPLLAEEMGEADVTRTAEPPPPGGTETILLAEDEATVRELHRMTLEEAGYRVIGAVDGEDALQKFREQMGEVDIVVTDVVMPKIDGKSLYEEIRKVRPDMKVLFMSGYTKDIVVERGILEDGFSFISKPVKSSELLGSVRNILDRTGTA